MRYTKRPVTIEAVRFIGALNGDPTFAAAENDIPQWLIEACSGPEEQTGSAWLRMFEPFVGEQRPVLMVGAMEGFTRCHIGDWITWDDGEIGMIPESVFTNDWLSDADQGPQEPSSLPYDQVKASIHLDAEHAWGWHCNLAVPIMDAIGCTHEQSNEAAAFLMSHLWDYDITTHPHYEGGKSDAQEYAEMRKQAEREEDELYDQPISEAKSSALAQQALARGEDIKAVFGDPELTPGRQVKTATVAKTITDPIVRAYVEGMGSFLEGKMSDERELLDLLRRTRTYLRGYLRLLERDAEAGEHNAVAELMNEIGAATGIEGAPAYVIGGDMIEQGDGS